MAPITITRAINAWYYVCMLAFIGLVLAWHVAHRDEAPYDTALKVFVCTGVVLCAMELGGFAAGIRSYVVGGVHDPPVAYLLAIIHGFGEGAAAGSVIYVMAEGLYSKHYRRTLAGFLSLAAVMVGFALLTTFA